MVLFLRIHATVDFGRRWLLLFVAHRRADARLDPLSD